MTTPIAKQEDGTVQLNFTIPWTEVKKSRDKALAELAKNVEIPGFRKGKAPLTKAAQKVSENELLERTVGQIFPKLFSQAIKDHGLKPITYPKLELVSAKEGEAWQLRATTAQMPEINLGDYQAKISGEIRAKSLKETPSKEVKEQIALSTLIKLVDFKIPQLLIKAEVDARLAQLLERIEKLGLTLEGYLASLGKKVENLRQEYETQAREALKLDLILNKVALEAKIEADEKAVTKAIEEATKANPSLAKSLEAPEQKQAIRSALRKRATIDYLASL